MISWFLLLRPFAGTKFAKFHSLHNKDTRAFWIECRVIGMSHESLLDHTNSSLQYNRPVWRTVCAERGKTSNSFSCPMTGLSELRSHRSHSPVAVWRICPVQVTDVDWNIVIRMCRRITQAHRLLCLTRTRSVNSTVLRRMTDFDDVTFQEQILFTKAEFLVILSNRQDKNGTLLVDETDLPVMMWRSVCPGGVWYVICKYY